MLWHKHYDTIDVIMFSYISQQKIRGFTIVELLVVIVVIAILASITAVAYNGIVRRADHSAVSTHIRQWEKIFEIYIAYHGRPPAANWRCLGDEATLPAKNGYAENFCFKPTNHTAGNGAGTTAPVDPVLMETLKNGESSVSFPGTRFPEANGFMHNSDEGQQIRVFRGVFYDGSTSNFADNPAVIGYFVHGSTCPVGEKVNGWATTSATSGCAFKLSVNENGQKRGECNRGAVPTDPAYNSYLLLHREGGRSVYCLRGEKVTL